MNIEMVVQNTDTGKAYDVSDLISSISIEWSMEDNPGKLEFTLNDIFIGDYISQGSPVSLKISNTNIFWGYVFKIGKNNKHETKITAYDQLRYLKSKDTYVFQGMSCSAIFKKICGDYNLRYKVISESNHILPQRLEDNKTLAEMIQYANDMTLINTRNWYFIRDNYGTLEFLNVWDQKTTICIGDQSLLTDYDYEGSIDGDTYNQIKLIREDKEKKKRELYIVKDSSNIKKWGLLQYSEKVNEKLNEAQIREKADMLLKKYNKVDKSIKLSCIGDFRVKAGVGVVIQIKDLEKDIPYNKYVIVTKVTHKIDNSKHLMDLEVKMEV